MSRLRLFRIANFINCFFFWVVMVLISIAVIEKTMQTWIIYYVIVMGCFSFGIGILSCAMKADSSGWHVGAAAICNTIFLMISMIHGGLAAEMLALNNQAKHGVMDSMQSVHFKLLLNAIVMVSLFNGNTIRVFDES